MGNVTQKSVLGSVTKWGHGAGDERDIQDLVSLSLGEGLICFSCN